MNRCIEKKKTTSHYIFVTIKKRKQERKNLIINCIIIIFLIICMLRGCAYTLCMFIYIFFLHCIIQKLKARGSSLIRYTHTHQTCVYFMYVFYVCMYLFIYIYFALLL